MANFLIDFVARVANWATRCKRCTHGGGHFAQASLCQLATEAAHLRNSSRPERNSQRRRRPFSKVAGPLSIINYQLAIVADARDALLALRGKIDRSLRCERRALFVRRRSLQSNAAATLSTCCFLSLRTVATLLFSTNSLLTFSRLPLAAKELRFVVALFSPLRRCCRRPEGKNNKPADNLLPISHTLSCVALVWWSNWAARKTRTERRQTSPSGAAIEASSSFWGATR